VKEDAGDGFGVSEAAVADPSKKAADGEAAEGDALVGFGTREAGGEALGGEDHHVLVDEAGRREEVEKLAEVARGVAGLLGKLAAGGGDGGFAGLDAAGSELPKEASGGVAKLADEKDAAAGKNRQDHDRAGMDDDVAGDADAARLDDAVAADTKDGAGIDGAAAEKACAGEREALGPGLGHGAVPPKLE